MAKKHMEEPHLKGFTNTCAQRGEYVIIKGINGAGRKFKEEGLNILDENGEKVHTNVSSKDMGVKAKSATSGTFAGLIPVDAMESAIGDRLRELKALKDPKYAVEIASLLAKIKETNEKTQAAIKSGKLNTTTAVINGEKMKVLADKVGQPLVPDYDLLTHTGKNSQKSDDENKLYFNKTFGYVTKTGTSLISDLNTNIADEDVKAGKISGKDKNLSNSKYKKSKTTTEFAHGADYANPNPDILSISPDRPITVGTPTGGSLEIKSNEEFVAFAAKIHKQGYTLPVNEGWGIEFEEGTVDYINIDGVEKNKDLGFANNKSAKAFWDKELSIIEAQLKEMGKLEDGTKNKNNAVLSLEIAKMAVKAEADNKPEIANKHWKSLQNLSERYQKNNNQEVSPVGRLMAKKDILKYHQACLTENPKEIEKAAYNITYGNQASFQIYKQSVTPEIINETIKQGQKHHHQLVKNQKTNDKVKKTDNNEHKIGALTEELKYQSRIIAQRREY